jgi:hypothetical protein
MSELRQKYSIGIDNIPLFFFCVLILLFSFLSSHVLGLSELFVRSVFFFRRAFFSRSDHLMSE